MRKRLKSKKFLVGTGVFLVAFFIGIAAFSSYSDKAEFCATCHIMSDAKLSYEATPGHSDVTCGGCHAPNNNIASKLVFKGTTGMGHLYYNTVAKEKIEMPIRATEKSLELLQDNCVRCHENVMADVNHGPKDSCISCHQHVGHGMTSFKTGQLD